MCMCDQFLENRPKRGKQFFSESMCKALLVNFFFQNNFFMAEKDKHWLALAYRAVASSGKL